MGALGNSRRGVRSPPLLIGALIACIVVVGFNYWVSNSRNVELQTKLYELEGIVRHAAAERSAVEKKKNEFEEELRKQGEQITRIESQNRNQLEAATAAWKEEKEKLLVNISSSTKTIITMKDQFSALSEKLEKMQEELQSCQEKARSLNKELAEEQAQCKSKMKGVKDECDAKVAAARLEAEHTMKKNSPVAPHPQTSPRPTEAKVLAGEDVMKKEEQVNPQKDSAQERAGPAEAQGKPQSDNAKQQELETHEIVSNGDDNQVPKPKATNSQVSPALVAANVKPVDKGVTEAEKKAANSTEEKELEVLDLHGTDLKAEDTWNHRVQTKLEEEEDADYNEEEQNIGEFEVDKEAQLTGKASKEQGKAHLETEVEEPADYNGDEDNEGEFEADKQMALSEM